MYVIDIYGHLATVCCNEVYYSKKGGLACKVVWLVHISVEYNLCSHCLIICNGYVVIV